MPTILSRFDMIFIIKDEHNVEKDTVSYGFAPKLPALFICLIYWPQRLARHVMKVHLSASALQEKEEVIEGELSLGLLKKFIAYCKQ